MKFLFSLPSFRKQLSPMAHDVLTMATLSERLVAEDRKRVAHVSGRAENVAEHSLMLVKVAVVLAQKYYSDLDAGKIAIYASLHDDIEAYVGDTPTGEWCNTDYEGKESLEAAGLAQLEKDFTPIFREYVDQVNQYEGQEDPEARFVRMVDKVIATAIQVTDGGVEVNKNFTKQDFYSNEKHGYDKHIDAYPEWHEVLNLKLEIAKYIEENILKK